MVEISERAAARINEVLVENPEYSGLRVGLKDGGCSGYVYLMDFESGPDDDDLIFERDGARVYVHPLHLPFLDGSALGWAEGEMQSGFHLNNPQISRMCGCGESFDVELS